MTDPNGNLRPPPKAAVAAPAVTMGFLLKENTHVRLQSFCRHIAAAPGRHSAARRSARSFDAASLALAVARLRATVPDHARLPPDAECAARSPGLGKHDGRYDRGFATLAFHLSGDQCEAACRPGKLHPDRYPGRSQLCRAGLRSGLQPDLDGLPHDRNHPRSRSPHSVAAAGFGRSDSILNALKQAEMTPWLRIQMMRAPPPAATDVNRPVTRVP